MAEGRKQKTENRRQKTVIGHRLSVIGFLLFSILYSLFAIAYCLSPAFMHHAQLDCLEVIPPLPMTLNPFFTIPPDWVISTYLRYSATISRYIGDLQMALKSRIYHFSSDCRFQKNSIQLLAIRRTVLMIYIQKIYIIFHQHIG